MAGNTNYKQIAVYKNRKALIEFTDDTRYEKKAMAWPFERTSRIRVNAKDYSEGIGNWAIDAHHNLSHDEFFRLSDALTGAKEKVTEDCTRCKKYLELLRGLQQGTPSVNENEILVKKIAEAEEELKKVQAGYVLFNERKFSIMRSTSTRRMKKNGRARCSRYLIFPSITSRIRLRLPPDGESPS